MKTILVSLTILLCVRCGVVEASEQGSASGGAEAALGQTKAESGAAEIGIPTSNRKVSNVIRMAEQELGSDHAGKAALISVEWCPADQFVPPQSGSSESWPESDREWSWFVTYKLGDVSPEFRGTIRVFRIRENGVIREEDFGDALPEKLSSTDESNPEPKRIDLSKEESAGKSSVEHWIHLLTDQSADAGAGNAGSESKTQAAGDGRDGAVNINILRIRRDMLRLIIGDIRDAESLVERKKYLEEFLGKSGEFLNEFPRQRNVWLLRAIVAIELERASEGWDAGRKVWEYFQDQIDDSKIRAVLAKLERKGWLREKSFEVARRGVSSWTNSLDMVFVPIDGTDLLFSIWETRVRDFEAFEQSTRHDAGNLMFVVKGEQLAELAGYNWKNPGFTQTKDDPVVGVNGEDAIAFCEWLTERERREGRIEAQHRYRLPQEGEWSKASGGAVYPWGNQWPLPIHAGNYAGSEANDGDWPKNSTTIADHQDGYAKTAPVGSFAPNPFGLFDVGGNVWEWCENLYSLNPRQRAQRGASWFNRAPEKLAVAFRAAEPSNRRSAWVGFRCVLDLGKPSD